MGFLYGLLCTNWSLYETIPRRVCKNSGTTSYKKSLFKVTPLLCLCTKWSPLYEVVFVRNGLCTK